MDIIYQKIDEREKRDPKDHYRAMFEKEMRELNERKFHEYEQMAEIKTSQQTSRQEFVDEISVRGKEEIAQNPKNIKNKDIKISESIIEK